MDIRLTACQQTYMMRLTPNYLTSGTETVQVSALVSCSAGMNASVSRSIREQIHQASLFGFKYNPLQPEVNDHWALRQVQQAQRVSSQRQQLSVNVPYNIIANDPRYFMRGVGVPAEIAVGSVQVRLSGYMIHLQIDFNPSSPLQVRVEVYSLSLRGTRVVLEMTRQQGASGGFIDMIISSGMVLVSSADVIRVALVDGTVEASKRFNGFLVYRV